MSLWRKLFGAKEEVQAKKVSLGEALEIAERKLAESNFDGAKKICSELKDSVGEFSSKVKALSEAKPPAMNKFLEAPVLESRNQSVMHLQKAVDEIRFPDELTYDGMKELHGELGRAIAGLSSINMKHSYYVSFGFNQHTDAIRKAAVNLGGLSSKFGEELRRIDREKAPYRMLLDEKKKLDEAAAAATSAKNELQEAQKNLLKMDEKLKSVSLELEKSSLGQEKAELEALHRQKEATEGKIYSQISTFSRALRKYEKVGNFDKKAGMLLAAYLANPVKTFLSDDDFALEKILAGMRKLLVKNELELKDNDKMIQAYDTMNFESLGTLKGECAGLDEKIADFQKRLEPLLGRQDALKGEVSSTALEIKSAKVREEHLQKKIIGQEQSIEEIQNAINKMVENFAEK